MAEDFVATITAPGWIQGLANQLLESGLVRGRLLKPVQLDTAADGELLMHYILEADWRAGLEYYVRKNRPVPANVAKGVAKGLRPKPNREGRNAIPESLAEQTARDIVCFFAVEYLTSEGMLKSPAEERVGKLMHLSRQAVGAAAKRGRKLHADLCKTAKKLA